MSDSALPQPKLDVRYRKGNFGPARYGPKGVYQLPEDRTITRNASGRSKLVFGAWMIGAIWFSTQVLAGELHYDQLLGTPLLLHFYAPWSIFTWSWMLLTTHFRSAAFMHTIPMLLAFPAVLILAGIVVATICGTGAYKKSLLNAPLPPDLHGSEAWAGPTQLQKMGLLPTKNPKKALAKKTN